MTYKKICAVLTSALLVGMTGGIVAAASYPDPYVSGDAAVVVGAQGTAAFSDYQAAVDINLDLSSRAGGTGGTTTAVGDNFWEVKTTSDNLEMGESIYDVEKYLDQSNFGLLKSDTIVNSKGTSAYDQHLYFHDRESSEVVYVEDDDADIVGDYFKILSGQNIARYIIDFTTNLESDITASTLVLDDVEDETINMLGKTYTITTAINGTSGVELTLMSGAAQGTIASGDEMQIGGYTISAVVSGSNNVKFTVDGTVIDEMAKGEIEPIQGTNDYIAVTDVDYESFSGGLHQATFWIGADKVTLKNGTSMEVNSNSVSGADVIISSTESGGDLTISEIEINMTAQDEYLVPVDGKLSEEIVLEGDEPGILIGQNWDIEFKGFAAVDTDTVKLDATESDRQYKLSFTNLDGDVAELPLVYSNASGMFGGDSADKTLVMLPGVGNITKSDYFILNTADPTTAGNNAKSYIVQYKGADKTTASSPKLELEITGVGTQKLSMDKTTAAGETLVTLKLGGGTFTFANQSDCSASDCSINLTSTDWSDGVKTNGTSVSQYLRTQSNALINITDLNWTADLGHVFPGVHVDVTGVWRVNITADDTARDGDNLTLPEMQYFAAFSNGSDTTDMVVTITKSPTWISDPADNNKYSYRTRYGTLIEEVDGDDSPSEATLTIPHSIIEPLVYVSSGELTVMSSNAVAGSIGNIVLYDNEVSSTSTSNLVVVGGSCVNSVAAALVGSPACGADFTTATGVGSGEFLIETFSSPYATGKVATLVAGYAAGDTTNAAKYLTSQTVDTTVGMKYTGTTSTSASLVTA